MRLPPAKDLPSTNQLLLDDYPAFVVAAPNFLWKLKFTLKTHLLFSELLLSLAIVSSWQI